MKIKKRSEDQIVSQIIEICANGTGKTRIIYQANLNSLKANHLNQRFQRLKTEIDALRLCLLDAEA